MTETEQTAAILRDGERPFPYMGTCARCGSQVRNIQSHRAPLVSTARCYCGAKVSVSRHGL